MAVILHCRSFSAGVVPAPTQLAHGELGINVADGKIFLKRSDGAVVEFFGRLPCYPLPWSGLAWADHTASTVVWRTAPGIPA